MIAKLSVLSIKSILHNKLRSFLTMLGIIIGVMAVVILVSITEGATSGITDSIASMGSDQITATISSSDVEIHAEDLEYLENISSIQSISPIISTSTRVKKKSTYRSYTVVGVTTSYFDDMDIKIQSGRYIKESDIEWNTYVAVIGTSVAENLFGTWDAVGGTIIISNRTYTVIGVLEEQGSSLVGSDDSKILIPYSTAIKLTGSEAVSTFYIKATSSDTVDAAMNTTEAYLYQLIQDEDGYSVNNQSEILDTMSSVTNTMSILLGGIAAISLIVGGIGIMNIMLVSVSERTKEIGIRKAVGAKRRHIMTQFLIEACILSILGGVIGILCSMFALEIYNIIANSTISINWTVGIGSVAFCGLIGVIFGSYPAAKASALQPIDALHNN